VIRDGDVLIHHPYESFTSSVERFIQAATDDPDVLAIKLTLYRIGADSTIARLLQQAAERGKQVAVLIELRARFDEESNIRWAKRLEDVGVHVSYGVAGLKTHAEGHPRGAPRGPVHSSLRAPRHRELRRPHRAALHRLRALLADANSAPICPISSTCSPASPIPSDSGRSSVAPSHLRQWVLDRIRREAITPGPGARGDPRQDERAGRSRGDHALYEPLQAGVEIDLILRGVCCLKPGVPGASDHIRVISILGRFLEHSRAYCFRNDGQNEVYIGSADWMQRNFDRRIEIAVPIRDIDQREAVYGILETMLSDNRQAWVLGPDGVYTQRQPGDEPERGSHKTFLDKSRETGIRLETGTFPITR
jgi:polyphosphate kinase